MHLIQKLGYGHANVNHQNKKKKKEKKKLVSILGAYTVAASEMKKGDGKFGKNY